MSFQTIIIAGHLGRDPEMRYTPPAAAAPAPPDAGAPEAVPAVQQPGAPAPPREHTISAATQGEIDEAMAALGFMPAREPGKGGGPGKKKRPAIDPHAHDVTPIGGAASPGQVTITPPSGPGQPPSTGISSTGLRNIAAVTSVDENMLLRMSTPVRTSLTATTNDDVRTIIEAVDSRNGATATAARMPENPVFSQFGTSRLPPCPGRTRELVR